MPWLWQTARDAWSRGHLAAAATCANASCLWVRMPLGSGSPGVVGGSPVSHQECEQRSSGAAAGRGVGSVPALPACGGQPGVSANRVSGVSEKMLV